MPQFRGSRKHLYDWVCDPTFPSQFNAILSRVDAQITDRDVWQPSSQSSAETELGQFLPKHYEGVRRADIDGWWLVHTKGAKSPTWDLISTASVGGSPGLVLLEAKAHVPEMSASGKPQANKASERSNANHMRIGEAIAQAREGLRSQFPDAALSRDFKYQLSNRVASAWRAAELGIPTVLVYLGFTGDEGIRYVGEPFRDEAHWQATFSAYLQDVVPLVALNVPIRTKKAPFWITSASLPVRTLTQRPAQYQNGTDVI